MAFAAIGAGISAASGLYGIFKGIHQNNLANKVVVPDATYNTSQYAQNNLGLAQSMFNSRNPGSAYAAQNIQGNNANTDAGIDRNATNGSQALALKMAAAGQTDQSFGNLGAQEGQWKLNMLSNLNNANNGMTMENDKVYQDRVRKQNLAMGEKNSLRGASTQNIGNGINAIGASAYGMSNMFQNGTGNSEGANAYQMQRIPPAY
jgi:hypothetical protein